MDLHRFKLKLNVNKITDPLVGPVILHEYLKDSKLIQGWVRFPGQKPCWHVWVEHKDEKIDIHTITTEARFEYLYEVEGEYDSDSQVLDTWDLYQRSPKDYWKSKPMGIRSKLLSNLRTC